MTQTHSEYLSPIRKRLETLRGAIDQDVPGLENAVLDLTMRQVMEMTTGLDSAVEAYQGAMQPYYRLTKRGKPSGSQGYYQRLRDQQQNIGTLADAAIQQQGYVISASILSETGYRESRVMKTLDALASEHGWEKKRDRETKSYRYAPKEQSAPQS